jgi:hypothetical protein
MMSEPACTNQSPTHATVIVAHPVQRLLNMSKCLELITLPFSLFTNCHERFHFDTLSPAFNK